MRPGTGDGSDDRRAQQLGWRARQQRCVTGHGQVGTRRRLNWPIDLLQQGGAGRAAMHQMQEDMPTGLTVIVIM